MNASGNSRVALPSDDPVFMGAAGLVGELRGAGHEAFVVGGAVRDLVMGRRPVEFDIATSAWPEDVSALFRRTVPVGIRFGVVRVLLGDFEYEVATFRSEAGYTDGRRPDSVRYTDLAEDVSRRDFTMNGLTLDPDTGEVADFVGGLDDIEAGLIRAIGDPAARFDEDRLRPLRAVRFAAQTGFRIEHATMEAIRENAGGVGSVSAERVRDEFSKLLVSAQPGLGAGLAFESGMMKVVLPEIEGAGEPAGRVCAVLDSLAGSPVETMWAALLMPVGPGGAMTVLRRLRQSNRVTDASSSIIGTAEEVRGLPDPDVAREKRVLRSGAAQGAVSVLGAWLAATGGDAACVEHARGRLEEWTKYDMFPERLVTGDDALAAGIGPGAAVGEALTGVEDEQLRGRIGTRDEALAYLRSWVDDQTRD